MSNDSWPPLLQWLLWGVAMCAVAAWLARSRLRPPAADEAHLMRHPSSTLWIGLVNAAFFFGIATIANTIGKNKTSTLGVTLLFIGFGLFSIPIVADYLWARHVLSDEGIAYRRMFGKRGFLAWKSVQKVEFSHAMKWFTLAQPSGPPVRISVMLTGLPEFARHVLQFTPQAAVDRETRKILDETRQGRPPDVMG